MGDVNGGPPQQSMYGGNQRFFQPQTGGMNPGLRQGGFGQAFDQMYARGGADPKGGPGGGAGMQSAGGLTGGPMNLDRGILRGPSSLGPQMSQPGMQQAFGDLRGAMPSAPMGGMAPGSVGGVPPQFGPGNAMGAATAPKMASGGGFDPMAFRRLMQMQ